MAETIRIQIPIETIDETDAGVQSADRNLEKLSKAEEKVGRSADRARDRVSRFDKSAEKTQRSLSQWAKEKYEVLLEAKERITPVLSAIGGRLRSFAGRTWNVTMKALDFVTRPVRGIINILKNPIFQVGAVLGVSIGMKDTIETYKNFESAMSKVQAISGASGASLEKLTEKAKSLGASTKFTATQVAEGFNYMGMAGWKTKDMMDGIEGVLNLSAASGEELSTTSDIVTDALTAFKMKASDANEFADVLAATASNANTTISGMGETFKYAGSMAGSLGYSIQDVALMTGLMANTGVKATMAGTALNSIFTRLSTNAGGSSKTMGALDILTKKLGVEFYTSKGKARDLSDVMGELRKATKGMNDEEKTYVANKIAGTQAQKGLLAILNASDADYKKLAKSINNADGAAANMSETMMDNLEGSITKFQSALDGVKLSLGERMAPYVRNIADWLTDEMPSIEKAFDEVMDFVDTKVENLQRKFENLSSTLEWKDSDFLGKAKLVWDDFIVEPLKAWWESSGRTKVASVMGDFGEVIGSGLNAGILTLLGFDVSGTLSEGESVGAEFARGFSAGFDFDEISSKLWDGFKNILSNASKLLPGGEEADLSSLLSAAMVAKIASPLISLGSSGVNLGKTLFGSKEAGGLALGSLLSKAWGGFSLDAELAGVGMAEGSGIAGMLGNVGMGLGATTAGGAVALGAGSVAGGIAGAAGLVHGGMDLYEGFTTNDKAKAEAYKKAGAIEVGGTLAGAGAGAATGAAIGAAFGGVGAVPGALIGAGVGAIASWFAGEKVKDDYEEDAEAAREAAERAKGIYKATGLEMDKLRFKNAKLNDALRDSEVSAEEFGEMFKEAVSDDLSRHFGDVALSLEDIKTAADNVVFGNQKMRLQKYTETAQATSNSLADLRSNMSKLEKMNWKAGANAKTNIKMSDIEVANYKQAVEDYMASAKDYLENQHYEATASVELILGKNGSTDIVDSFDTAYAGIEDDLTKLSKKLSKKVTSALEDGIIDANEQKAIERLQQKIKNITEKISKAQDQASLESLKIQFSNVDLDAKSFGSLQEQLAANTAEMQKTYQDALQTSLTNLELSKDTMSDKEYQEKYDEIQKGYNEQIKALNDRSINFQLDMITDAYSKELDKILPDMEGTTQEKLGSVLQSAISKSPDPAKWETKDIIKWFGLDAVGSSDTATAIAGLIQQMAGSVTEDQKAVWMEAFEKTVPDASYIMEHLNWDKLTSDGKIPNDGAQSQKMMEQFVNSLINSYKTDANFTGLQEFMNDYVNSAVSDVDVDASKTATEAGTTIGNSLKDSAKTSIEGGSTEIKSALETSINSATASPFTPNVQISPNYNVTQPGNNLFQFPLPQQKVTKHASGGFAASKQLSWLAEEGYGEFVIPTNPSRRGRALELYEQAGRMLGVGEHASGGFVGGNLQDSVIGSNSATDNDNLIFINQAAKDAQRGYNEVTEVPYGDQSTELDEPSYNVEPASQETAEKNVNVEVNVSVSPEFNVSAESGDSGDIMDQIRANMSQLADELGGEIASRLEDVFSNMPA